MVVVCGILNICVEADGRDGCAACMAILLLLFLVLFLFFLIVIFILIFLSVPCLSTSNRTQEKEKDEE